MSAIEAVQAAIVAALQGHAGIADAVSGVFDGPPPRAAFPYIVIADSPVSDWSTKTALGREMRLALTVWDDGEAPTRLHSLMAMVEEAVAALPRDLPGWRIASSLFLRSMIVRDAAGPWAGLVEHRIRVLSI
ncbi:MAG: DUF3168 domain-containing protein [Chakrabartia sp.]